MAVCPVQGAAALAAVLSVVFAGSWAWDRRRRR
jgi:hypothetical protein